MTAMNNNIHVLILAYYFPPDSSSGSLRPLHFANHLQKMGVRVTVITAREKDFLPEQPVDINLLSQVDNKICIIRSKVRRPREFILGLCGKSNNNKKQSQETASPDLSQKDNLKNTGQSIWKNIKDLITDLLASPDPHVGWIPGCIHNGKKIIRDKQVDIVIATGSPWSSLIAGVILRRKTGIPLLLDFRDPWTANPGFSQRGRVAAFLEKLMERLVVARTSGIIANTKELRDDFLKSFKFLSKMQVHTLTNGFEEYNSSNKQINEKLTIVHAGALYFSRTPLPFLQAVHDLLKEKKIPPAKINIILVGGISINNKSLHKLLQDDTIKEIITITPRVSYDQALKYQMKSDILLLIQPGFPLQVPRKLYEYMATQKPVLALTETDSATARIVNECSLGVVAENNPDSIKPALMAMYSSWKNKKTNERSFEKTSYYKNTILTEKLYGIIKQTISGKQ